jgi:hypothetical protein
MCKKYHIRNIYLNFMVFNKAKWWAISGDTYTPTFNHWTSPLVNFHRSSKND